MLDWLFRRKLITDPTRWEDLDLAVLRYVAMQLEAKHESIGSGEIARDMDLPLDVVHDSLLRLIDDKCIEARVLKGNAITQDVMVLDRKPNLN